MSNSGGSGGRVSEVKLLFAERLFLQNNRLKKDDCLTKGDYQKQENRTTKRPLNDDSYFFYKTNTYELFLEVN